MKIDIEEIESILLQKQITPQKVQEIVRDLEKVAEELAEERKATSGHKLKWEHIIVLNDPDGIVKGKEFTGFVIQQPSDGDSNLVMSKLCDAVKNQNEVTKKKSNIIKDIQSLFGHLKSKFVKEKGLKIKTKESVRVIISDGKMI